MPLYHGENGSFLHLAQVAQLESTRAWASVSVCVNRPIDLELPSLPAETGCNVEENHMRAPKPHW